MESLGKQIKSRLDDLIQDDRNPRDQLDCTHFIIESLKYLTPGQCRQLSFIKKYTKQREFLLNILEANKGIPEKVKVMIRDILAIGN